MRTTVFPRSVTRTVMCKGHCGKYVPSWITPDVCRHCASVTSFVASLRLNSQTQAKCSKCGGPRKRDKQIKMCYKCMIEEFPERLCVCGTKFNEHKDFLICETCRKNRMKDNLNKRLGEIDSTWAVQVKLRQTTTSHSGYCSGHDSDNLSHEEFVEKIYFPATSKILKSEKILDKLMTYMSSNALKIKSCGCSDCENHADILSYKLKLKTPHTKLLSWANYINLEEFTRDYSPTC